MKKSQSQAALDDTELLMKRGAEREDEEPAEGSQHREAESKWWQHQQQQAGSEMLTLNLRGERIYMPRAVLEAEYQELHAKLTGPHSVPHLQCPSGERYYDADPTVFRLLLGYYKYQKMHLPSYICGPLLEKEVEFWGVRVTPDCLEACCMHSALESKRWKVLLDDFERKALAPPEDDSLLALPSGSDGQPRFAALWNVLSRPCSSITAALYALLIFTCSLASAILYTKDTPEPCSDWAFRGGEAANCTLPDGTPSHAARADFAGVTAQCAFALLFTVDLLLRALLAPNRAKFVRSPHTWNDVLSLVPLYGFLLHRMTGSRVSLTSPTGWLFELLSVALFFRVFRIVRHFMGVRVMAYTLMTGMSDLLIVMLLVFTATFLFGTVFFLMERSTAENRNKVPTMFHGYYWAVITITTVGYGDITPSTVEGRILAILCSLVGLIVVAFTVPILTGNFHRYYGHTCHLSLRGELGICVIKARRFVRQAKAKIYNSAC